MTGGLAGLSSRDLWLEEDSLRWSMAESWHTVSEVLST
jgi:hypothetical protein